MKFKMVENVSNEYVKQYRKLAQLNDDEKITNENLDRDALTKVASENFLERDKLTEMLLEDADTIGAAAEAVANKIDAEVVVEEDDVKKELDRALTTNKRLQRLGKTDGWANILLTGEAGIGKTARVKQWANERGINLYIRRASDLDSTDMGGAITPDKDAKKVNRLTTSEWDPLDRPNSVLFLDELNRAASDVRGSLLTLINNHTISDIHDPSGERFLKNMLFTIVAINPADGRHNVDELDSAEYDRMKEVPVIANKRSLLKYLVAQFDKFIAEETDKDEKLVLEGQKALTQKLLGDKRFVFDGSKERDEIDQKKFCSPRTFEAAINNCDGTKQDLLDVWVGNCGAHSLPMVKLILSDYVDIKDKANDALNRDTESDIFAKDQNIVDQLLAKLKSKK